MQTVQQKLIEEIELKRSNSTKPMELYYAFYISIYCEELPPPATFLGGPSSPRLTPSALSSLEKPEYEAAENRKLRIKVQNLQTLVNES